MQVGFVKTVERSQEDLTGIMEGSPLFMVPISPAQWAPWLVIGWGTFFGQVLNKNKLLAPVVIHFILT